MSRDFSSDNDARKRNDLLTQYYGIAAKSETETNPLDIDGKDFNAEIFVEQLVKVGITIS